MDPQIDECIEVTVERVDGSDVQNEVDQDVRVQVTDEQQRGGAGIVDADRSRLLRSAEVVGHERDPALCGTLFAGRVERDEQGPALRARVHVHGEVRSQDLAHERDELLGEPAEHDARVCVSRRRGQLLHAGRVLHHP